MWAPDVYEGAPTPVTAFLSVGSKAAAFAMLLRIFLEGVPSMSADWRLLFEALAIVTMTVGNLAALTQSNLKRMLAYSSIAHAGYLLMGVVAGTPRGVSAMLIYLFIYSFMQLGAFAVIVMMRRADVAGDELKDFSGLHFRHPFAAFAMLLFMLSLGGIPPTAGFMGKLWLFGAAIDAGYFWLAIIGVLNTAVSLYYYIRIVVFMYLRKETTGSEPVARPALAFTLALAVAGTILFGVYPRLLFEIAEASARTLGAAGPWHSFPEALPLRSRRLFRRWRLRSGAGELFHKDTIYSTLRHRGVRDNGALCVRTTWSGRQSPCRRILSGRGRR